MTQKQKKVFDFIKKFIKEKKYAPSQEEIRRHFGLASKSTANYYLKKLEEGGFLDKKEYKSRAIDIRKNEPLIQVPLMGLITAGQPLTIFENRETIAVPKNRVPSFGEIYALKVVGDSMIDENINNGDVILVKQQSVAENGQKVVALVDGNDTTLKKFYREKNRIRLQPANKNLEPIIIKKGREFQIQGIFIDVIKTNIAEQPAQALVLQSKNNFRKRSNISDYLNKVYNGDIMHVLKDLPDDSVDMIFGDPDYNVGIKYGDNNYTRNFDDYINWYIELTKESMRVLKNDGNLFMINYPQQNAHLRVKYLDLHFSNINEYVWVYNTNIGHTPKRFTTAHRSILHVRKSANNKFFKDMVALPYKNPTDKRIQKNLANGSKGRMPYSWFEFNLVKNVSKEKTYHACQIPQKLTEMIIRASTKPKDIALILFGGSGAEIDVCKNLNRQFISAEIDKKYCDIINDRLFKGFIDQKYRLNSRNKNTSALSKN